MVFEYVPGGEVRLTVEQNVILPNVDDADLKALLAEPCLNGDSRLSVEPGNIVGNLVSCTGAQFCGLALIETKAPAESTARELQKPSNVRRAEQYETRPTTHTRPTRSLSDRSETKRPATRSCPLTRVRRARPPHRLCPEPGVDRA